MATAASRRVPPDIDYPSGDGLPMAESPLHRQNLTDQTPAERIAEAEAAKAQAEAEIQRLRRELEALRRRLDE